MLDFPASGNFNGAAGGGSFRYDGSKWRGGSNMTLLRSLNPVPAGSLDGREAYYMTIPVPAGFRGYKLLLRNFGGSGNGAAIYMQFSFDGGASMVSAANYNYSGTRANLNGLLHFTHTTSGVATMFPLTALEAYNATFPQNFFEIDFWGDAGTMWAFNVTSGYSLTSPSQSPCIAIMGGGYPSGGAISHLRIYHWDGSKVVQYGKYDLFGML